MSVRDLSVDARVDKQLNRNIESGATKNPWWSSTVEALSQVMGYGWIRRARTEGD